MSDPLGGVHAKLQRAGEHLETLRSESVTFFEGHPYTLALDRNADATNYVLRVRVSSTPNFLRWGLVAGDCFHNMRCVLDHLVYAIAVTEAGADPPPKERQLQFPITTTKEEWRKQAWRIQSLSPDARAAIEGLQPHGGRDAAGDHPGLVLLNDFDTSDKHRVLNVVTLHVSEGQNLVEGMIPGQQVTFDSPMVPLEDDAPVLRMFFDRPTPDVKVKSDFRVVVACARRSKTGPEWHNLEGAILTTRAEVERVIDVLRPFVR